MVPGDGGPFKALEPIGASCIWGLPSSPLSLDMISKTARISFVFSDYSPKNNLLFYLPPPPSFFQVQLSFALVRYRNPLIFLLFMLLVVGISLGVHR